MTSRVRKVHLELADERALEHEAERYNPVNPTTMSLYSTEKRQNKKGSGATPSMGLSQFRGGAVNGNPRVEVQSLAHRRAMWIEQNRLKESNPKELLNNRFENTNRLVGQGATPSMGLSQFRGGKHTLLDHLEHPTKGYGTKKGQVRKTARRAYEGGNLFQAIKKHVDSNDSLTSQVEEAQGETQGSGRSNKYSGEHSEAHQMGRQLRDHLLELHGKGYTDAFCIGMGASGTMYVGGYRGGGDSWWWTVVKIAFPIVGAVELLLSIPAISNEIFNRNSWTRKYILPYGTFVTQAFGYLALAAGTILAFTGIATPLGLSLIAGGAVLVEGSILARGVNKITNIAQELIQEIIPEMLEAYGKYQEKDDLEQLKLAIKKGIEGINKIIELVKTTIELMEDLGTEGASELVFGKEWDTIVENGVKLVLAMIEYGACDIIIPIVQELRKNDKRNDFKQLDSLLNIDDIVEPWENDPNYYHPETDAEREAREAREFERQLAHEKAVKRNNQPFRKYMSEAIRNFNKIANQPPFKTYSQTQKDVWLENEMKRISNERDKTDYPIANVGSGKRSKSKRKGPATGSQRASTMLKNTMPGRNRNEGPPLLSGNIDGVWSGTGKRRGRPRKGGDMLNQPMPISDTNISLTGVKDNVLPEEEEPMEDMNDNQSMSDVEAPIEGSGMTGAYEGQGQGRRKTKQQKRMVGGNDGRRKRADIVKRIMKEKGLKMIEASKYVKQHNLYTK